MTAVEPITPGQGTIPRPPPPAGTQHTPPWVPTTPPHYPPPVHHHAPAAPVNTAIPASAQAILLPILDQFGLGSLINWAWQRFKELGGGTDATNIIQFELPQQKAFKDRFPAYEIMAQRGEAWTAGQIVQYEQSARDQLNSLGLANDYSNQELQSLLTGGVSISELGARVNAAQTFASAPNQVRDQLQSLYGITDKQLAGYWFDPQRSLSRITQQYAAAETAGESQIAGYGQLTKDEAEALSAAGVTGTAARSAFSNMAGEQGLTTAQADENGGLSRQQQLGFITGNAAAQQAFKQRQASRTAQFQGAAGYGTGPQGVTGLGDQTK